jgi:phosphoribosylamine-glycine ligase
MGSDFVTSGGRVLGVTAVAPELKSAIDKAYQAIFLISFDKMHFRKDIGHKALTRLS